MFRALAGALPLLLLVACATTPASPGGADDPLTVARTLSSADMAGRRAGTEGNARARAYLTAQIEALGLPVTEQPFAFEGRRGAVSGVNVVTLIEGTGREGTEEKGGSAPLLVVTAHYDHLGTRDGVVFHGADDNASGVAGAMALAKRLTDAPARYDVLIALTDAEEMGLRGAEALFAGGPLTGRAVAANLNLDMIGRDDGAELYAVGTHHTPALRPLLEEVAASAAVPLAFGYDVPTDDPRNDWTELSDHAPFHRRGIPFVYLGVEDHADYHRPTDTYEALDEGFLLGAIDTAERVLRALDEAAAAGIIGAPVAPVAPVAPGV